MTNDATLILALRHLADDIDSEDGVANAAIAEAAERLDFLAKQARLDAEKIIDLSGKHAKLTERVDELESDHAKITAERDGAVRNRDRLHGELGACRQQLAIEVKARMQEEARCKSRTESLDIAIREREEYRREYVATDKQAVRLVAERDLALDRIDKLQARVTQLESQLESVACRVCHSLLARSTPPEVVWPERGPCSVIGRTWERARDKMWIAALAAAGVAVKEVRSSLETAGIKSIA
jgi:chromosome segregation ATPase